MLLISGCIGKSGIVYGLLICLGWICDFFRQNSVNLGKMWKCNHDWCAPKEPMPVILMLREDAKQALKDS